MQRGARIDCVDAAGFVVLVPAATGVFPDGVFNPFLEELELVMLCNVLGRGTRSVHRLG